MLKKITVENFIFIEHVDLEFTSGFNVITGETGAGKSILLAALNATLGENISADLIQSGKDFLKVTSIFDVSGSPRAAKILAENNFNLINGIVTLRREINRDGKSKCYINDEYSNKSLLKKIAILLLDIHSQHDNHSLLNSKNHLSIYDYFIGIKKEVAHYRKRYNDFLLLEEEKKKIEKRRLEYQEQKEFIKYSVEELEKGLLPVEEYNKLQEKVKSAENSVENIENLNSIYRDLDTSVTALEKINENINKPTMQQPALLKFNKNATAFLEELKENKEVVLSLMDKDEFSAQEIDIINSKLAKVESLKRKYNLTIEQLQEKLQENKKKLSFLEDANFETEELTKKIEILKSELLGLSEKIFQVRKNSKEQFEKKIKEKLSFLGMETSHFSFQFNDFTEEEIYPFARGEGKFIYRSSKESLFFPLEKIASGGEISRIMLAIKSLLSNQFPIPTIIFDEIDVGIGGNTAFSIGKEILSMSYQKQVIVITHLAQIAKFADSHFQVIKEYKDEKTNIKIGKISDREQRIIEIARMLGIKIEQEKNYQSVVQFMKNE